MATGLLYLADTYRTSAPATILATGEDERGWFVQTDQTIFYPQGGGQPADRGVFKTGTTEIPISFTGFRDGIVYHYTPHDLSQLELNGQSVEQEIDLRHRLTNSRTHTAGHLLAHILETMDESLVPAKGHHFPDGSYVELANPAEKPVSEWLDDLNTRLAASIAADLPVTATLTDYDTVAKVRPSLAPFTPRDKPSRIVQIGEYLALPCGGTHVASLKELGILFVTKAKTKQGATKVSYQVEATP
jgi:Ser-tRNA(Ala) deacylase AlaX